MKKLLITGASGFLGSHLVKDAKPRFDVYGWANTLKIDLEESKCAYFDLSEKNRLENELNRINPDYIIHCAAISSEALCKQKPETAKAVNVDVVVQIAKWCEKHQKRLIFTSTDLVFDGENAPYLETDDFDSSLFYGTLKRQAELALVDNPFVSIVRLPLLYGIGLGERKGLLFHFIEKCKNGEVQGLFIDEFRNPAWVQDIATFLLQLLAVKQQGLLHLGGKERVSRLELGNQFCQYLNLSNKNLKAITRAEIGMQDRPKDTTMKSQTAYNLGFNPHNLKSALLSISKELY